jgi:hypothetical protein
LNKIIESLKNRLNPIIKFNEIKFNVSLLKNESDIRFGKMDEMDDSLTEMYGTIDDKIQKTNNDTVLQLKNLEHKWINEEKTRRISINDEMCNKTK